MKSLTPNILRLPLFACVVMVCLLIPQLWPHFSRNLDFIPILGAVAHVKPLSPDEFTLHKETRATSPDLAKMLSELRRHGEPCRVEASSRLLGVLHLLNGEPTAAMDALGCVQQPDILSAYFEALTCTAKEQPCRQSLDLAGFLRQGGTHLWTTEYYEAGLASLLLSEQVDSLPRADKAKAYQLMAVGADSLLHDPQQAIRWSRLWLQVAPNDLNAYFVLSHNYLNAGKGSAAMQVLKEAERHGARLNWQFGFLMGQSLSAQGEMERAVEAYRESWALNPPDPSVSWYLASALLSLHKDDEAVPYLQFLARLDRAQPYWASLADAANRQLRRLRR